jgi:hypothetical protein
VSTLKKAGSSQINNLMMHLKPLENQEQTKLKTSKREIIKIRAEINEIKTKQTIKRINETQSWFFEKINNIDKPSTSTTKWSRKKTQMNKIREEKEDIITNTNEIQIIIRKYFEHLYSSKLLNLDEIDKFLDVYNQPKWNQEDINHLNSPITSSNKESPYKE